MGNWYQTNFAVLPSGRVISVYDAVNMEASELKGSLSHIISGKPVKFVHCAEREDYFAILNRGEISKEEQQIYRESPLHKLAKAMFLKFGGTFHLGDAVYKASDILEISSEVRLSGVSKNVDDYLIPDVTIRFSNCTYFVEIFNKHKLTLDKLNKYKYYYNTHHEKCFVLEIAIHDIDCNKPYVEIESALRNRLFVSSGKVYDMETWVGNESVTSMFGTCFHCGSGLRICNNVADPLSSRKGGLECKIPRVRIEDQSKHALGDKTSIGSAMLYCPKCLDGRYIQMLCPECLSKGVLTPLDLLYNEQCGDKRAQFILKCKKYMSVKDIEKVEKCDMQHVDRDDICNFCINILEADGVTVSPDLAIIGGFPNLYKSWSKTRKRLRNYRDSVR